MSSQVVDRHVRWSMFHPNGPTFVELARQALSSTQRGYDLLAPKFDHTPFRTPNWILEDVAAKLQPLAPFQDVLDVCCGTGAAMQMLMPLCQRQMVGIDISPGMLSVAATNLTLPQSQAKVELICGDVLSMSFKQRFDLAVSFGAFGHILPQDQPRLIQQIAESLKPGGRFAFVTSYMPSVWSQQYWLSRGFNAAMRIRNALLAPPFIMYYLTFLLPEVRSMLKGQGLVVSDESLIDGPRGKLYLVVATRR